jgi:hypothetical protein
VSGRDRQDNFAAIGRCDQLEGGLTKVSNLHVRGCYFRNWWNCLQPRVFNFDWNAVRQSNSGHATKEKESKPGKHD